MEKQLFYASTIGYENGCWVFENLVNPQELDEGLAYLVKNDFLLKNNTELFGCVVSSGFYYTGDLLVYTGNEKYDVVSNSTLI